MKATPLARCLHCATTRVTAQQMLGMELWGFAFAPLHQPPLQVAACKKQRSVKPPSWTCGQFESSAAAVLCLLTGASQASGAWRAATACC